MMSLQLSAAGSCLAAGAGRGSGPQGKSRINGKQQSPLPGILLGVMASGNVVVPLDVQLNEETFADNVNRSDLDILFYDWDHYGLVEAVKEKCPRLRACISLQHGKHVPCSDQILKGYAGISVDPVVSEEDCAMVLFTSGTTGRGKGVMLSNRNLMDNNFCTTDKDHPEKKFT